ncbi:MULTISPECIES: hypothetical protein [Rhodococcus]|uniref:hypothetical protein n=1 Tax=Rhodococcus TaxID=1827 RepID=UPI001CF87546|nr:MULTISPECIES: hypothetical protein [Rhodococcus]
MPTSLIRRRRFGVRFAAAVGALALGLTATACSSDDDGSAADSTASSAAAETTGQWPRTIETAQGPVTIESQPQRIVSTSVTLTGSLLALDAPVHGTGAQPASTVTTESGLFTQWADVAEERGVEILHQR